MFGILRIGRRPHIDAANSQRPRPGVASVPSSEPSHNWPACANMSAAAWIVTAARGPDGIRFAPEMICACTAIMPHIFIFGEMPVTACLISLALVGLVVIAVSEECS